MSNTSLFDVARERLSAISRLVHFKCGIEFCFSVAKHPAVDPKELAALGLAVDIPDSQEEWIVSCIRPSCRGCPGLKLFAQSELCKLIAENGELRLVYADMDHLHCNDRHSHIPGIYNLKQKPRLVFSKYGIHGQDQSDANPVAPIGDESVPHTQATTNAGDSKCDPLSPYRHALPQDRSNAVDCTRSAAIKASES